MGMVSFNFLFSFLPPNCSIANNEPHVGDREKLIMNWKNETNAIDVIFTTHDNNVDVTGTHG